MCILSDLPNASTGPGDIMNNSACNLQFQTVIPWAPDVCLDIMANYSSSTCLLEGDLISASFLYRDDWWFGLFVCSQLLVFVCLVEIGSNYSWPWLSYHRKWGADFTCTCSYVTLRLCVHISGTVSCQIQFFNVVLPPRAFILSHTCFQYACIIHSANEL